MKKYEALFRTIIGSIFLAVGLGMTFISHWNLCVPGSLRRICLLNSLMFGLGGYLTSKFISPAFNTFFQKWRLPIKNTIAVLTFLFFCIDLMISIIIPNVGIGITG